MTRLRPPPAAPSEVRLREELEAIERRARETRIRLALGEATTGITGLLDIESRCRDALASPDDESPRPRH